MNENQFAQALKKRDPNPTPTQSVAPTLERGSKHVGGYFHPDVARKLKQIALDEDTTVQALVAEALATLLHTRGVTINQEL